MQSLQPSYEVDTWLQLDRRWQQDNEKGGVTCSIQTPAYVFFPLFHIIEVLSISPQDKNNMQMPLWNLKSAHIFFIFGEISSYWILLKKI